MRKAWRLQGSSETCIIAPRSLVSQEEQGAYLAAQLDRWLADPLTHGTVLDIYESIRGQSAVLARRLGGQEMQRYVKSEILEAFKRGEFVLMRMPHVSILPTLERQEKQAAADEPPPTEAPLQKEKTWVGIELVDQKDRPVPQARYVLELPDGTKKSGRLDDNGVAQVRDINRGTCKVWFPDFDGSEWEGGTAVTTEAASEPPPAANEEPPATTGEKNWVDLELVDEEGNPVPNARYQLCLPDGTDRIGTLGDDGRRREEGIDPGICKVTFPDYDATEWDVA